MRGGVDQSGNKRGAARPDLASGFDPEKSSLEDAKESFRIRDLSREFGVTARTLRFYEECKLLAPRREGQDRIYSRRDRARLKLVLMGKSAGFSLDEIRAMLDLYDLGDGQVTQLTVAARRFQEQVEKLKSQRENINKAIAELERASEIVAQRLAGR